MRSPFPLIPLFAVGCAGASPDPTDFLIGMTELHANLLTELIFHGIEACGGPDLWDRKEKVVDWNGACGVPSATGESYGVSGDVNLDIAVHAAVKHLENEWNWTIRAEYTDVTVGEVTFSGLGDWTAETRAIEHLTHEIHWQGDLTGPWPDEVVVTFDGLFSGNVHEVTGSVGDDTVDYENSNPDVP